MKQATDPETLILKCTACEALLKTVFMILNKSPNVAKRTPKNKPSTVFYATEGMFSYREINNDPVSIDPVSNGKLWLF